MGSELSDAERDSMIQQFCSVTGVSPNEVTPSLLPSGEHLRGYCNKCMNVKSKANTHCMQALSLLASGDWDLDSSLAYYYQEQEHEALDHNPSSSHAPGNTLGSSSGQRTLGGDPAAPQASASSSHPSKSNRRPQGGMHTLQDLQNASGHDHDDEDDEHDPQDLFAGGEKSGLAVQNPGTPQDLMNQLLQRARQNVPRPGADDPDASTSRSHFSGRGFTLGGEGTDSRVVEDPHANVPRPLPRVNRTLHIWRDGFSVDDGPLHHNDDPENQEIMREFLQGRAPLNILNVEHNQEVNVEMDLRQDQDYVKPKPTYKPFSGAGQRLGSPAPALSGSSSSAAPPASTTPAAATASGPSVNDSEPTVTLQIRLGDGTRLTSRFNTSHTIGDVYSFVNAASTESRQRSYVLQTTFPSKELLDQSIKLAEMDEFKRGGVVVQKWK